MRLVALETLAEGPQGSLYQCATARHTRSAMSAKSEGRSAAVFGQKASNDTRQLRPSRMTGTAQGAAGATRVSVLQIDS